MEPTVMFVSADGEQFSCCPDQELRDTLLRISQGDPALQSLLLSGGAGKVQQQQAVCLKLDGARAETIQDLIAFVHSKELPTDEPERLQPLYMLSAKLQLFSLRDAIEASMAKEASLTPKVGLSSEEYRSGRWRERYQRPQEVGKAVEMITSLGTDLADMTVSRSSFGSSGAGGPPLLSDDFEARRRKREIAAALSALPDAFGILGTAKSARYPSSS